MRSPLLTLAIKDLRLLSRDRIAAFFTLVFPLGVAIFFGLAFGGGGDEPEAMPLAVYSEAEGAAADAFMATLREHDSLLVTTVESAAAGEALVRKADAVALLTLPASYATGVDRLFEGGGAELQLTVDPSRRAEGAMLVGTIYQVAMQSAMRSMMDPAQFKRMIDSLEQQLAHSGMSSDELSAVRKSMELGRKAWQSQEDGNRATGDGAPTRGWEPVRIEVTALPARTDAPTSAFAISFLQGVVWALFGVVLAFSIGLAEEREHGTLLRLLVSPLSPAQILIGKSIACLIAALLVQWFIIGVGVAFFGLAVGSWWLLVISTTAIAWCCAGVMMFLAGACRTRSGAEGAGRGILLMLALLGGGSIPLMFMPGFLRTASGISPFKWAVVTLEGCPWRAWDAATLAPSLAILAGIGVVGLVAGTSLIRRRLA